MKKILTALLGLIILSLIGIGFWFGTKEIISHLKGTDSKVFPTIITASATILVGLGAVLISQNKIKKREIEEAHRESKIEVYTKFNDFLFRLISGTNEKVTGSEIPEQEMIDFMVGFKRDLMFRASPKVIKALLQFEIKSNEKGVNILIYMNDLLLEMRKDIGLSNGSLDNYELIQMFLKDKSEVNMLKK